MLIQTNWYVLTGGPSSGKTKTLEFLSFLGYSTIPEAARVHIDNEMSKGRTLDEIRADEEEFQKSVLAMKLSAENICDPNALTFLDRGIPDSIAYFAFRGVKDVAPLKLSKLRKYKGIFLLESAPFERDYARTENSGEARQLEQLLYQTYSSLGYNLVRVPLMPIEERASFILSHVNL